MGNFGDDYTIRINVAERRGWCLESKDHYLEFLPFLLKYFQLKTNLYLY
jgi:hypothetical protein